VILKFSYTFLSPPFSFISQRLPNFWHFVYAEPRHGNSRAAVLEAPPPPSLHPSIYSSIHPEIPMSSPVRGLEIAYHSTLAVGPC